MHNIIESVTCGQNKKYVRLINSEIQINFQTNRNENLRLYLKDKISGFTKGFLVFEIRKSEIKK